jgi:DNA-binding transcriptional LysR family regulator
MPGLNITLAAERVHATQPGLSKQLKQLEDELGFLLFSRKGRSLETITPGGVQILEHARRILAEAGNIRSYAANQRGDGAGRLELVTTHTQARYVLPNAIAALRKQYPDVSFHLTPEGEGDVLDRLVRGEADFALISTTGSVPQAGLAVPLYRWRRVVLVPDGHALARSKASPSLTHARGLSAGELRVGVASGFLPASRLCQRRAGSRVCTHRTRSRPDQDLCACRSGRGPAGRDGDGDERCRPARAAGAGGGARMRGLGGAAARTRVA